MPKKKIPEFRDEAAERAFWERLPEFFHPLGFWPQLTECCVVNGGLYSKSPIVRLYSE